MILSHPPLDGDPRTPRHGLRFLFLHFPVRSLSRSL